MTINEEGVNAIREIADRAMAAYQELGESVHHIKETAALYYDATKQYRIGFDECISGIENSLKELAEPIQTLSNLLYEVYEAYMEVISNDKFSVKDGIIS